MTPDQKPNAAVMRKRGEKGRAVLSDTFARKALDNAIVRKTNSEAMLKQLGLSSEKSLVDKVLELLELSETLDATNPVSVSANTSTAFVEALDAVSASVNRLKQQLNALDQMRDDEASR
jgi:hypothetical protein